MDGEISGTPADSRLALLAELSLGLPVASSPMPLHALPPQPSSTALVAAPKEEVLPLHAAFGILVVLLTALLSSLAPTAQTSYGTWSAWETCPSTSVVCGIQTLTESLPSSDYTGMNNLRARCCFAIWPANDDGALSRDEARALDAVCVRVRAS